MYNKELISGSNNGNYRHGLYSTRFYNIWHHVKKRCLNKNAQNYSYYGGRGITVSERWLDFINFRDDMYNAYLEHAKAFGEKDTSIDRIDNDGNYCVENCRWATGKIQRHNQR